jgi:hypothetical protein
MGEALKQDKIIVFLDDDPNRAALQFQRMNEIDKQRTFWVQTVRETLDILKDYRDRLDIVSLGYNLNGGVCPAHPASEECGLEVIRWLERCNSADFEHVRFIVHTWNSTAGVKMVRRLREKGYRAIRVPFGS